MVKEDVMLNNKTGLHARPATEIAKTAMSYKSDITFLVNDKKINAKSPLMLMAAGIKSKTEIEIICNGEDEKEALETSSATSSASKLSPCLPSIIAFAITSAINLTALIASSFPGIA